MRKSVFIRSRYKKFKADSKYGEVQKIDMRNKMYVRWM